jgi:RNA-directed DNA polymerase
MLFIRQVKHLAYALGTSVERLTKVLEKPEEYYEELVLTDPSRPGKERIVVNVKGTIRRFQSSLYRKVLLKKLTPSVYSFGGAVGRNIKENLLKHKKSSFVFKTDIADFYPSIHYQRVYRLFADEFKCSPDVARLCTKLCTYKHHLALGFITSPFLADQILRTVDKRIGAACQKCGLIYTRYVDDITISGSFDLELSGIPKLVERILEEHGFEVNPLKHKFGRLSEVPITNLRVVRGHIDVLEEYADEVEQQLENAARLARGEQFDHVYYTPSQIFGRVRFVCWINPGRRSRLLRKCRSIRWLLVETEATRHGLVASKKSTSRKDY